MLVGTKSNPDVGSIGFVRAPGEPDPLTREEQAALGERMGLPNFARRLVQEEGLLSIKRRFRQSRTPLRQLLNKDALLSFLLQRLGLWRRGRKSFRKIQIVKNEIQLTALPRDWDGFRLLQISDLHIDLDPGLLRPLCKILSGLLFDRVVLTGDFQDLLLHPHEPVLQCMKKLIPFLGPEPIAIPGNHDLASLIVKLEAAGLRFLLNEHILLQRGSSHLAIIGVDDPHGFRGDDLARALTGIPSGVPRILLAHSPAIYSQACDAGVDLLLSGHTHGGQICLPGGIPLVRNAKVPRALFCGDWREQNLVGYTSRGTGGCGVPVRFCCSPEVTLHTLRSG